MLPVFAGVTIKVVQLSKSIKSCVCVQEEKTGAKASEAKDIKLYSQVPPIEKMDSSLSSLTSCE